MAALQALHPTGMKVKIAGTAVVEVVVALGAEVWVMTSVKSASMAAARTASKGRTSNDCVVVGCQLAHHRPVMVLKIAVVKLPADVALSR